MSNYFKKLASDFLNGIDRLKGRKVVVLGHLRPDGDCIGSQVALCRCLCALGVEAAAVNADNIPRVLRGFVGDTRWYSGRDFDGNGHLAVTVDCADHNRVGSELYAQFPEILINVDHHISNGSYGQINIIDAETSATAEILAGLMVDNNLPLDPITAQALYVGIATDTGQFRFQSTTHRVFKLICELVARGADPAAAALALYEQESFPKIRLLQHFLSSLSLECSGKVCIGMLADGVFAETGALMEDTEGLVDYARAIHGVEIGVLLEEGKGVIKGSFRSKDPVHRVDVLAKQLGGGGHACAAGFNLEGSMDCFRMQLIDVLENHFRELKSQPQSAGSLAGRE